MSLVTLEQLRIEAGAETPVLGPRGGKPDRWPRDLDAVHEALHRLAPLLEVDGLNFALLRTARILARATAASMNSPAAIAVPLDPQVEAVMTARPHVGRFLAGHAGLVVDLGPRIIRQ